MNWNLYYHHITDWTASWHCQKKLAYKQKSHDLPAKMMTGTLFMEDRIENDASKIQNVKYM